MWNSFLRFYLFIYLFFSEREEGKGREKNTLIQEWNIDPLLPLCPTPGIKPKTQACVPTRNRTGNVLVHRTVPNPPSHTSQGRNFYFQCKRAYDIQVLLWYYFITGCFIGWLGTKIHHSSTSEWPHCDYLKISFIVSVGLIKDQLVPKSMTKK